jgi:hypothetical protein
MLIAEARVETDRPGRYLAQLCQHLSNKGRHLGNDTGRHRPRDHSGDQRRPDMAEQARVEWSQTDGTVSFPGGQCVMAADRDALVLRATADDEETLRFIEDLITSHLGRFSRRERLTVAWRHTGAPAAQPPPGGPAG